MVLDAGGVDEPLSDALLAHVTIFSPNETECVFAFYLYTCRSTFSSSSLSTTLLTAHTLFHTRRLNRITGLPTDNDDQIIAAAKSLGSKGVSKVLVKLGGQGSMMVSKKEGGGDEWEIFRQPIIPAPKVVDTTGAGDTFTAAFAVAYLEGKGSQEAMKFATAAASLCVRKMGAMSSAPTRKEIDDLLAATP